jgi:hypothetical protein
VRALSNQVEFWRSLLATCHVVFISILAVAGTTIAGNFALGAAYERVFAKEANMELYSSLPRWLGVPLVCSVLGVTGCSAARPPVAQVAQAELAVSQAAQSKAPVYAPADLRIAREKLASAQHEMVIDDYDDARRLAEQAVIDAQLAQAKANASEAQYNAEEVRKTIATLRSEATRAPLP